MQRGEITEPAKCAVGVRISRAAGKWTRRAALCGRIENVNGIAADPRDKFLLLRIVRHARIAGILHRIASPGLLVPTQQRMVFQIERTDLAAAKQNEQT